MDRHSHERPLNNRPFLQRAREVVALEALKPRPEADVHRRRVLRLQTGDALKRLGKRRSSPLEEELAGEQRAVEGALCQGGRQAVVLPWSRADFYAVPW